MGWEFTAGVANHGWYAVLAPGTRLGPYEILGLLGVGGMGQVHRARDTRLGREVAVKLLREELAIDPERIRRFEKEACAAAALNHPNILALYDLGTHAGKPYLVTELLEGETLAEFIHSGDLGVAQSVELGIQIANALAAVHQRGIVHRDLKPSNVFITTDGVVKLLDFGLAKLVEDVPHEDAETLSHAPAGATEPGRVMGTVGYMAPEQVRGQAVDHRADIFAFGCVFYEMLSGMRAFSGDTAADTISAILSKDPPPLTLGPHGVPPPLDTVVRRCLEKRPENRFSSAHDLGLALQAVARAVPREAARRREEKRPYPGLAAFTEEDAERFFGRREEVAAAWRKIPERRLLALIGPSGAGKTSFLRAGIVAHAPAGWRCLVATPGQAPFAGLARALAPTFAGDATAFQQLLDFHEGETALSLITRWRERGDRGLVVVDQFEELFTLNGEDVQAGFADLLGRISSLDGVHVLVSMRDDFLFGCHTHASLGPVFEGIIPLGPPTGDDLRRAVVEPAAKQGFAFEDEALVEEMLHAVEGERGALPLLAFTLAQLWEERDREGKFLTREAYAKLGGVAGALAQHAERTLERTGEAGVPIVREILRNLTTAQQTRSVLDVEELLSVFPEGERNNAGQVLRQLVDARLLTSFEIEGPEGSRHHCVEIVHESLLTAWPRLVRWRTEDEGGAQLRDQLRQAAHLWEERGKPEDLLWTGTSYREYQVWRERYSGGLSELEEAFGVAMRELAGRRRRRRRLAYAAVLVAVVIVATGLALLLRRSVEETHRAEAELGQREAAQLLALGRLCLADHPNGALAYAIASLECSDNDAARRFAVEALWQSPPALFLSDPVRSESMGWSPDGRWLALAGNRGLVVLERSTGVWRQLSSAYESIATIAFTSDGRRLVTKAALGALHVWALPEGRLERTFGDAGSAVVLVGDRLLTVAPSTRDPEGEPSRIVRSISLDGSARATVGEWKPHGLHGEWQMDPSGSSILSMQGNHLTQQRLDALAAPPRVLGSHDGDACVWMPPWGDRVVTGDAAGGVRIWDVPSGRLERTLKSPADARRVAIDPKGRFLATGPPGAGAPRSAFLFDLAAPRTAEPALIPGSDALTCTGMNFSPDGAWLARVHLGTVGLWNMAGARSTVVGRQKPPLGNVAFTRNGDLLSASGEGVLRRWPLSAVAGENAQVLWSRPGEMIAWLLAVDPQNRFVAMPLQFRGEIVRVPLDGSRPSIHRMARPQGTSLLAAVGSLDPNGRWLAMATYLTGHPELNGIRLIDLDTGDERTLDAHSKGEGGCEEVGSGAEGLAAPAWLGDGRLVSDGDAGLRVWDVAAGTSRLLRPCRKYSVDLLVFASPDSRVVLSLDPTETTGGVSSLSAFDLVSGATREITSHGKTVLCLAFDPSGRVLVTGSQDGVVRVGPLDGGEPHLLFGHTGPIQGVAVSPDERWIASVADDGTIRLWPMPDMTRPTLHTLPHDELLAKLRSLTNLRAARDPSSDTGWTIEIGPFPGWANVPEWQP